MAKKGGTFVCIPCGMEIIVTESGVAYSEIICCGEVMAPGPGKAAAVKAPAKKAAKKKAPAKKAARKKAPAKKAARKKTARKK
jgi:hypothetical protein